MSDYLSNLAAKNLRPEAAVHPRLSSYFGSQSANLSAPSFTQPATPPSEFDSEQNTDFDPMAPPGEDFSRKQPPGFASRAIASIAPNKPAGSPASRTDQAAVSSSELAEAQQHDQIAFDRSTASNGPTISSSLRTPQAPAGPSESSETSQDDQNPFDHAPVRLLNASLAWRRGGDNESSSSKTGSNANGGTPSPPLTRKGGLPSEQDVQTPRAAPRESTIELTAEQKSLLAKLQAAVFGENGNQPPDIVAAHSQASDVDPSPMIRQTTVEHIEAPRETRSAPQANAGESLSGSSSRLTSLVPSTALAMGIPESAARKRALKPPVASAPSQPGPSVQSEQIIQVTIGRIEVRATQPPAANPDKQRGAPSVMTLDDYLRQRAKGGVE